MQDVALALVVGLAVSVGTFLLLYRPFRRMEEGRLSVFSIILICVFSVLVTMAAVKIIGDMIEWG